VALTKVERKYEGGSIRIELVGEPEYVGKVLSIHTKVERIMSDVWDDVSYATVLEADGSTKTICVGGCEFGWNYKCEIDADPKVIADWNARVEAAAKAAHEAQMKAEAEQRAKQYEADCKRSALAPTKGRTVTVTKGRKVPVGTVGVVTWEGTDSYRGEARIGIKDAAGHVHYTAASNATANVNKPDGLTWAEFVEGQRASRPVKDAGAKILATGQVGLCFYVSDDRFGIAVTSRKERQSESKARSSFPRECRWPHRSTKTRWSSRSDYRFRTAGVMPTSSSASFERASALLFCSRGTHSQRISKEQVLTTARTFSSTLM
jgi:hypothetical protein